MPHRFLPATSSWSAPASASRPMASSTDGFSCIDESSITGEPLPREKQPGDEVFSGTLNSGNGLLRIRVIPRRQ